MPGKLSLCVKMSEWDIMLAILTQPKIGSRFGLDSVPNRDVAKSSFGREEYETVSSRKEGSIRDAFSGDSCSYRGCFEGEWPEMSSRA